MKLQLLGRWHEPPLVAWPGYCVDAQRQFAKISGFRLRPFIVLRNGSFEHYYELAEVRELREWFGESEATERLSFVYRLCSEYYKDAQSLRGWVDDVSEVDVVRLSDIELIRQLQAWGTKSSRLAGMAFFAVLLDIWFEDTEYREKIDYETEILNSLAIARDHCANVYDADGKEQARRLLSEAARRLNTHLSYLEMLGLDEVISWLGGADGLVEEIRSRREFCVSATVEEKFLTCSGTEAEEWVLSAELAPTGEPRDELRGIAAYGGVVSGNCKRVLKPSDFEEFAEDDILVAYNTSKSYEPLFARAKAVLTELGGLTSHAAVVCAEMQVPCVVGISDLVVSVADGDHLLVDADVGTVVIERSK